MENNEIVDALGGQRVTLHLRGGIVLSSYTLAGMNDEYAVYKDDAGRRALIRKEDIIALITEPPDE